LIFYFKKIYRDIGISGLNLLHLGQRHLLVEDYSSAVNYLQEACELLDKKHGIGAQECGEAYLYYGCALLELARLEDGVIDGLVHTKCAYFTIKLLNFIRILILKHKQLYYLLNK
jgi:hypothetical protein